MPVADRLLPAGAVAIPGGTRYRLGDPSADCELLDVTLPAVVVLDGETDG